MYTQCPKCETVFHITMEQLQSHGGLVRCGQCDHVFNADQRLFDDVPDKSAQAPKKPRAGGNNKPKSVKPKTVEAAEVPSQKPARQPKKPPGNDIAKEIEALTEEVDATPPPWAPPSRKRKAKRAAAPQDSAKTRARTTLLPEAWLEHAAPRRYSSLWILGIALLTMAFATQAAYFYRDQLAAYPELRPYLIRACAEVGCTVRPPYDAGRIELVQPTNISPHPRFANALRLRATLVNRADKPQPPPLMQVALTDSAGRVLSRRTFTPAQYLERRTAMGAGMPPHLAIDALLDLTNPDGKAVGYQIEFFPPPIH